MRKLMRVDLLVLDDFALQSLDAVETADFYDYAARVTMPRSPAHGQVTTVLEGFRSA